MSDSVRPHRWPPTRLPCPWDFPGKNTGIGCHFLLQCMKVKSESEVTQSCAILSDLMDCSLPGSSVHGIFQARVLEWGAIAFSNDQPRQHIKKHRHYFADKGSSSQSYGFISSHIWMWELDHKQSWVPKNWCFWIVALESLYSKEIKPVNPKGSQPWMFIGNTVAEAEANTVAEAEAAILWPPDARSLLVWKDPAVGKDWRQEEKGMT